MAAKLKMPQSTVRYFVKQAYQHFQMTGKTQPLKSKTVHVDSLGNPVYMTVELDIANRLAYAMWDDGKTMIGQEVEIRKSWGIGY